MSRFRELFEQTQTNATDFYPLSEDARAQADAIHLRRTQVADELFSVLLEEQDALRAKGIELSRTDFVVNIACGGKKLRCFCDFEDYRISLHGVKDHREQRRPFSIKSLDVALSEIAGTMKTHFPNWAD